MQLSPFIYRPRLSLVFNKAITAEVAKLLDMQRPSAVVRAIPQFVIYSVNRVAWRGWESHVFNKIVERPSPPFANSDSAAAVSPISAYARVVAAAKHVAICAINFCAAQAVSSFRRTQIATLAAAATLAVAFYQVTPVNTQSVAAFALANDYGDCLATRCFARLATDCGKLSKFFANDIPCCLHKYFSLVDNRIVPQINK